MDEVELSEVESGDTLTLFLRRFTQIYGHMRSDMSEQHVSGLA